MPEGPYLENIIIAYRIVIDQRYDYDQIVQRFDVPASFQRSQFDDLRSYFLTYIYPPPEDRAKLNVAFDSLEGHIANPRFLLSILKDSISIIFRYGRHLPKILSVGLQAMQSFKKANAFEQKLAAAAQEANSTPPFSKKDIDYFTVQLPRAEVNAFIEDSLQLFQVLHNRKLVSKIISIVNVIISKMEARPTVYLSKDIDALRLGRDLVVEGDRLFESLSEMERDVLFDIVEQIEREVLDELYDNAKDN